MPATPLFDHALERYESLKGNAEGELDITIKEGFDNVVAKEGTIHTNLNLCVGRHGPDGVDTSQKKAFAPFESWILPGRCKKSMTCPVWAHVQTKG